MNSLHANIKYLRERSALLGALRRFFDGRGFLEVQPPCLSRDSVVDAYLDPLHIDSRHFGIASVDLPARFDLQTSPESAMKRMLAAGAPSIYSIGPVFRAGERGAQHNVEFTMLEWYDVGAGMDEGVEFLGSVAGYCLGYDSYDVRSYRDLFREELDFDPIGAPLETLCRRAETIDREMAASLSADRDGLLDFLLTNLVQPKLGTDRPLIVTHYPLSQAALAKASADDPECAARFELFVGGMELANGYDELLDPDVLLERYQKNNAQRIAVGRPPMTVQTTLLDTMRQGMPACAGVALGVDRLLMALTGSPSIDEVIPFPIERA